MTNEEKQKIESEQLIDELSKMPPMVIATAYLHAINYTLYGEDVTKKWTTATQNARALEKAYREGYSAALQKMRTESEADADNEETREMLTADERALFLNKLTHWLKDNFNDIVIGGWQDTDGEIFDLFFIKRERKTVKED